MKDALVASRAKGCVFQGFLISSNSPDETYRKNFFDTISVALHLIQLYDTRRYRRVARHVKVIYGNPVITDTAAFYIRHFRLCVVGCPDFFLQLGTDTRPYITKVSAAYFALVLIHEATHGRFDAAFIPYSSDLKERIERLCTMEEYRFLKLLEKDGVNIETLIAHNPRYQTLKAAEGEGQQMI